MTSRGSHLITQGNLTLCRLTKSAVLFITWEVEEGNRKSRINLDFKISWHH